MFRALKHCLHLAWFSGLLACLLLSSLFQTSCADDHSEKNEIYKLIQDLTSDRFDVREAAMRTLKEREDAIPLLRKARLSPDLEVKRRVEEILRALERKRAIRCLDKVKVLGKEGRPIEVADRLAYAAASDVAAKEGWEGLTRLASRVITNTNSRSFPGFRRNEAFPTGEFSRYAKRVQPKEILKRNISIDFGTPIRQVKGADFDVRLFQKTQGRLLLGAEQVSLLSGNKLGFGLSTGIIAASGDVQITSAVDSIIVAGGDVKKVSRLFDCILICDGDVELLWPPEAGNVIIARGSVKCATGKIKNCIVRSGRTLLLPDGKTIDLKEGVADPLAFVKFFELADVGLSAEDLPLRDQSEINSVRLKDVQKESPFATGLCAGDVIMAIDEIKTPTTEIFRRVLRRTLAKGGPLITFTVRRVDKTLDVSISVRD